ncbi:MAG: hypothetical protein DI629_18800 [Mesorhizobium amorphae]|nr:MAG: hypothetical protein DI629_18800 [Mesorhizobium amorphae]
MARYGAVETARSRFETWRQGFRDMVRINYLLSAATLACVLITGWAVTRPREVLYLVLDQNGQMTQVQPVDEPVFQDNMVINFATEAITRAMRITFDKWREDNAEASIYFTDEGWRQFLEALQASLTLDYIRDNKLNSSATPQDTVIIDRGVDAKGRYSWVVQVNYRINYQGTTGANIDRQYRADMVLVRVPTHENPRAIAVDRINVR